MADLYLNWQSRLKVTSDEAGDLVLWNRDQNIIRTKLPGAISFGGTYELTPADVGLTLAQGDITTIQFLYLESDIDGLGWKTIGASYTMLKRRIPGEPGIAQLMTEATSVVISAGGTSGGNLTYFMAGV